MASLLLRRQSRFMPRLIAALARLRTLPRGLRRRFQRRAAVSLAGAALVLALGAANFGSPGAGVVYAAAINVADGEIDLDAGNGACSLIEAVLNANDDGVDHSGGDCVLGSGPDTISLPTNGTFTFTASYVYDYGNNGLPTITSEITIAGDGSTLDLGGPQVGIRLVHVDATGNLTLEDTTVTGGYMVNAGHSGGVFRVDGGSLTISGSTLRNSAARSYGGAIFAGDGATLEIINESTISGNSAFRGGGINSSDSNTYVQLSNISDNYAGRGGGGILAAGGQLDITHATINLNNGRYYGGGVFAHGVELSIFGTTVDDNESGYAGAGGLHIQRSNDVVISRSTISNNTGGGGGGIGWGGVGDSGPYATTGIITNTTISGNEAYYGGGILLEVGDLTLNNVTVTGNTAAQGGGLLVTYYNGYYSNPAFSTLTLNRTLISGNSAYLGAEILSSGTPGATITADNFNLFGHAGLTDADAFTGTFTPGSNDITATSDGTEPTALADILDGTLMLNSFLVNVPLPPPETQTHALTANSPAVDRAPSAACAATPVDNIDQRGEPRNVDIPGAGDEGGGSLCDIGAYELQFVPTGGICPAGAADNQWTDIIGMGMGSPKKHKNTAKVVIPNAGDVVALYGQMVAKDEGKANYVRFLYPGKNNYVQVDAVTSLSPRSGSLFWYGSALDPTSNIRGRWFLQPTGAKKHIPRALVLYPTYETAPDESYANVFKLLDASDTQVYWDIPGGWSQSRQIEIDIPAPLAAATLNVKLALVDNDKDVRPIYVTAFAGGVSQTLQPTGPNRGDQLNILEFTLENVPAGTDVITITIESPAPFSDGVGALGGDSAALVGVAANYVCAP